MGNYSTIGRDSNVLPGRTREWIYTCWLWVVKKFTQTFGPGLGLEARCGRAKILSRVCFLVKKLYYRDLLGATVGPRVVV